MIDSATFTPVTGAAITLNDDNIPFKRFDVRTDIRGQVLDKQREHGAYDTYTYMGVTHIEAEGDLFGLDSTAYNIRRQALVTALMPPAVPIRGPLGTLAVQFTGKNEVWFIEVTLETSPELPLEANSPSRSTYLIQWHSFTPYWTGLSSGLSFIY